MSAHYEPETAADYAAFAPQAAHAASEVGQDEPRDTHEGFGVIVWGAVLLACAAAMWVGVMW